MTAGVGADERAQALAGRVEQKRSELERLERQQRSWAAGAEGERLVGARLDALRDSGWVVAHDVHWPGRPKANLDHVLVGPGGVAVVDTKNWSGEVRVRDGVLRCAGYRKDREVTSALSQAAAVGALLEPRHRPYAVAVLCLVQHDQSAQDVAGVTVVGRGAVNQYLLGLPVVLGPEEVAAVGASLQQALSVGTRPAQPTAVSAAAVPVPVPKRRPGARPRRGGEGIRTSTPRTAVPRLRQRQRRSSGRGLVLKLLLVVALLMTVQTWTPLLGAVIADMVTSGLTAPAPTPPTSPSEPVTP